MIEARDLSYSYSGLKVILKDINFKIEEGEFWGVLGKNGAGKTTLIDLMMGMKHPSSGDLVILNEGNERLSKASKDIAFISQDIVLKASMKIKDFLDFHSFFYPNYCKQMEEELLSLFEVDKDVKIGTLSTGQQKRVQIVSTLSSNTKILIIDEITAVLDPEARNKFFKTIIELNKEKKITIILATNIFEDLEGRIDKILYIDSCSAQVLGPGMMGEILDVG